MCPGAPGRDAGDQRGEDHDQLPRALPHSDQLHQVENLDFLDSVIETLMMASFQVKKQKERHATVHSPRRTYEESH